MGTGEPRVISQTILTRRPPTVFARPETPEGGQAFSGEEGGGALGLACLGHAFRVLLAGDSAEGFTRHEQRGIEGHLHPKVVVLLNYM